MAKVNNNTYELRKKLSDFTDEFSWEFKFVINNYYWAEPSKDDINITRATKDGFYLNTYNLHFLTNYPDKNGNAHFKLKGYKNAKKVILSGTFNRWNEELFKMNKTEEGWELTLLLKPGEYEYKFIVDGNWMEDPDNPLKKRNEFNGFNSLININKLITFKLDNHLNAKKVILSGSFNNWDENNYSMLKTKSGWEYSIKLSGGKHHYKFIVDGNWIVDPKNSVKEYDYDGNINSVCIIK
nr:glycogen-binding domain-containing protein [Lutibacter sp. B1]